MKIIALFFTHEFFSILPAFGRANIADCKLYSSAVKVNFGEILKETLKIGNLIDKRAAIMDKYDSERK